MEIFQEILVSQTFLLQLLFQKPKSFIAYFSIEWREVASPNATSVEGMTAKLLFAHIFHNRRQIKLHNVQECFE